MLAIEKHEILARLEEGHLVLTEAVRGVDQHKVAWKSSEQSWSIQECVEHLVLSEEYLLSRLTLAEASPTVFFPIRCARPGSLCPFGNTA